MGNCRDCKHWDKQALVGRHSGYGQKLRGYGMCSVIIDDYGNNDIHDTAFVMGGDYADTAGELLTKPDFGCVLWEADADAD